MLVPFGVTASELACKRARHATLVDEEECGGSDDCLSDAADDSDDATADAGVAAATAAVDAHLRAHCDVCPLLLRSEAVALAQRASTTLARVEARLRRRPRPAPAPPAGPLPSRQADIQRNSLRHLWCRRV